MINFNQGNTLNQQNNEFPVGSSIDITGYVPLFGDQFNEPNQVARLFLDANKYAAMGFSTANKTIGTVGQISWTMVSATEFTLHLSTCPGDFDGVVDQYCKSSGVDSALAWKIGQKPSSNAGTYCYLEPDKTYYLNVVAAQEGLWSQSTCVDAYCTWLVAVGGFLG